MTDRWLSGWKEIAGYIGVSERTAQRYRAECAGFPVFLKNGAPKAKRADLDAWIREAEGRQEATNNAKSGHAAGIA